MTPSPTGLALVLAGPAAARIATEPELPRPGLGVVALALLLAAVVLPGLRRLANLLSPPRRSLPAPWRALDLLWVLLIGVVVLLLLSLFTVLVWGSDAGDLPILVALVQTAFLMASIGTAAALLAWKRVGPRGLAALGLGRGAEGRAAAFGALAYAVFAPLLWLGLILWPSLADLLGIPLEAQEVLVDVAALRGAALAAALVLAVPVVPFLEELVFRGFLQTHLGARFGMRAGIVLTSVVFASLHGASAFGPIFLLSLFLGWLRVRTEGLTACWAAHALHNALTLAFTLAVTP